ncbi:MAG: methylenetetrahydrofolate--tRNA-(uracil(54)-C(5))-methyltransferase (FADH(2)-oxidizing) TrmFO [Chthonomonas sp.]|nr:methylenetetrahydrofolate--tRNA-(uracil(54)-C(5))-methyltransferase (FADH(2)-oxidizing) TrmFO [Chthonomonas sp.]
MKVVVVGAGFAGVEAAWALANRGAQVELYEMRPATTTPAHTTGYFAELVCSNSLKSKNPESPAGLLKTEMASLGSLILAMAKEHEVPGGQALAVDRDKFGAAVTATISEHPNVTVRASEWTPALIDATTPTILATGPLSTDPVSEFLATITGRTHLHFYDAVSPVVEASSLDRSIVFAQSRYDKGEGDDYLNCPFEKDSYLAFVEALISAERAPFHAFEAGGKRDGEATGREEDLVEKVKYFAGCMPIEVIAEGGPRSLAFGNFKPVGLEDPRTGRRPYAALQLRPENREKTLYSLVACQNRLRFGEQQRVFRMVPGLERAEFVRYGVIHRNTYLNAPQVLSDDLSLRSMSNVWVAGQLTGVEGYVESAAMGIYAALAVLARHTGAALPTPPAATAYGSLLGHLQDDTPREFAPMNVNWGLLPGFETERDKGVKRGKKIEAAHAAWESWLPKVGNLSV